MKTIIGAYIIDTPFSALNNRGIDKRAANENEVATKVIRSPEGERPYVSAQALRYWWRTLLEERFNWNCSPVELVKKNQAVTKADPLEYDDDDVFGYMSARKVETGENDSKGKPKMENVTVTRVSPLKCSPLIGFPIRPISDFGSFTRKMEGDPILFAHQFYSNILKGIFALDADSVGRYTSYDKPGSKNLSKDLEDIYAEKGLKQDENLYLISSELKKKRISDTIKALKYINGGAMQALHHTDVTPKIIVLALLNGGNNIFMDIFPHNDYSKGILNLDAFREVLEDYHDDFLSKVYLGYLSGFGSEKEKEIPHFKSPKEVDVVITTPGKAIDKFIEEILAMGDIFGE
jgi:CRISPR-associated protein Cst2